MPTTSAPTTSCCHPGRQPHRHDEPGAGRHLRRHDEGNRAIAERFEVVVGLEDWISAQDNIRLLDAIGSDFVAVYYDAHNIVSRVPDIYVEPKLLGKHISQIHVKNANDLLSTPGGKIDWTRMSKEFYDIGYRGWYVLEPVADERHRGRHPRQHRVREEDVPDAAGPRAGAVSPHRFRSSARRERPGLARLLDLQRPALWLRPSPTSTIQEGER